MGGPPTYADGRICEDGAKPWDNHFGAAGELSRLNCTQHLVEYLESNLFRINVDREEFLQHRRESRKGERAAVELREELFLGCGASFSDLLAQV